jgi:hypothetical protein
LTKWEHIFVVWGIPIIFILTLIDVIIEGHL